MPQIIMFLVIFVLCAVLGGVGQLRAETEFDLSDIPVSPMVTREQYEFIRREAASTEMRSRIIQRQNSELEREKRTLAEENRQLIKENLALQADNKTLRHENETLRATNAKCLSERERAQTKVKEQQALLREKTVPQPAEDNRFVAPSSSDYFVKTAVEPITGMKFVWVDGGEYWMGCGSWSSDCGAEEKPAHRVGVRGFWLGMHEVTQGQWYEIMGNNPSHYQEGDDYPVEKVSWRDAHDFLNKLNSRVPKGFRLPTEAEWEYAARDRGRGIKYPWGAEEPICRKGAANGAKFDDDRDCNETGTEPVGSYGANGLGLYDMSGNVWEWCEDWYARDYYSRSPVFNPRGPISGADRVWRGGGWSSMGKMTRTSARSGFSPDSRFPYLGFRLAAPREAFAR